MSDMEIDNQSFSVAIIPPQPPKSSKKQIIKDYEFKINSDHNRLDFYLTINKIYMQNLMLRKQKPRISPQIRSIIGMNCVIYKQFTITESQGKQFMADQNTIQGNIHVMYNSQLNVQIKIYFSKQVKRREDHAWILIHYSSSGIWKSKNFNLTQEGKTFSTKIPVDDFNEYLQPNALINISFRRKQVSNSDYLGIINLGNTCFMNSSLQMLFYIRPLRKIILDSKSKNKIIKALKNNFIQLLDVSQKRPVDAQELLQSNQKYNQIPRRQQDVQQFLFDFINQLEKQCPEVKTLWQGKCAETTYSTEKDKPYKSTRPEQFSQLDVHMFDTKGNYFENIQESLHCLLHQQQVDEMIQNDQFGKICVSKYRTFQSLPDVLFINIKRYEWNKDKLRLSKILGHIQYGENINLGFLIGTPGNTDINPECDYTLYSVIVHKGSSPQNGHYFVFVNTSSHYQKPHWVQFNDSTVRLADQEEVMKFTGKKGKQTILDKNIGRFVQKDLQSDESSYLLVYLRTSIFNDYQSIETHLPKSYIQQKMKRNAQKQQKNIQQINVFTLTNQNVSVNLFQSDLEYISVPLPKDQSLTQGLRKISKSLIGNSSPHIYKVSTNSKKVKLVYSYQTAGQFVKFKRGCESFDYILLVSQDILAQNKIQDGQQLGIVVCIRNQFQDITVPYLSLMSNRRLNDLQDKITQKGGRIKFLTDREDFQQMWNLYNEIQLQKSD